MRLSSSLKLSALLPDCPHEYADLEISGLSDPQAFESGDCICCFTAHEIQTLITHPNLHQIACLIGPVEYISDRTLPYIYVKQPRLILQNMLAVLAAREAWRAPACLGIHSTSVISPLAKIAKNVTVGPYSIIDEYAQLDEGVIVGSHCIVESFSHLHAHVKLDHHVVLKKRCIIGESTCVQSHTTMGSDGFGFERVGSHWAQLVHLSGVIVGARCFIGSHVAIAAGALKPTELCSDVIIDNHVQIAHHVKIGRGTAIAGCVGIAGSTIIGDNCLIAGGTKISGQLKIVDNVRITGMTMVTKSLLTAGVYSSGIPVDTNKEWKKKMITLNRLTKKEMEKHENNR